MLMDGADAAPQFELGRVALSRGAAYLPHADIRDALARHRACDWGDITPEGHAANADALKSGGRLISVHYSAYGVQFIVTTKGDRSTTTVLLRSELSRL